MPLNFIKKFRRITYSTSYLPEIDGLRFLAIFMVVVIMHISHYLDVKFYGNQLTDNSYWKNFMLQGGSGVPLFFIISGFILSLPFAKWRLNGEKKIILKNYYLRRLTRLEPPYVIALVIFFIAHVWLLKNFSFNELIPRLIASIFYLHTIIYDSISWVLPIAWSLEVEVQFYILAPLFFLIFLIRAAILRWVLCAAIIAVSSVYWFDSWTLPHLFMFLHYFFMGILLCDFYCCGFVMFRNKYVGATVGIVSLTGLIFIPSIHNFPGYIAHLICMFLLFHTVLTNATMKKIFSLEGIIIIGGMCYSIYLLHFAIVSALGQALMKFGLASSNKLYFLPYAVLFGLVVLILSAAYFLWVEKPFMKPWGLKSNSKM